MTAILALATDIVSHGHIGLRGTEPSASAVVLELPTAAVRSCNLAMFDELVEGMLAALGDTPRLAELRPRARAAIARLPVQILGPGMLNRHRDLETGNDNITNLMSILIETDRMLRSGCSTNTADAFVRAMQCVLGCDLEEARLGALQAANDCEFFAPELVLLLSRLRY